LRGGQDFNLRHRKRLAIDRRISSLKRQEAGDYRKNRDADGHFFCRTPRPNGRHNCDAGGKTKRFVHFIPHFSRRPSFERPRLANQPCPSLYSTTPSRGRLSHLRQSSVSFSPLIRLDAGILAILERHLTMKHD
jgi:hypothetical protein